MPPEIFFDCPRCLSKGQVDQADIERLNRSQEWIPGPCGYCCGKGKVTALILNNISADDTNLFAGTTEEERDAYIKTKQENPIITTYSDNTASNTSQSEGSSDVLIGLGLIVLGLIITGVTYFAASNSPTGGRYVITTGLFVVGVIRVFKGMAN